MATADPLRTLFENQEKDGKGNFGVDIPDIPEDDMMEEGPKAGGGKSSKSNKRLSVERIYQKKSQLEHILLRPDTYVGSVESVTQPMWVYDDLEEQMVQKEITFVPGLYKIFDEILVNAADNKQRDPKMNLIKIDIDPENNRVKIWNNGKGIPVVEHKTEKIYVPTMIFGHLLTSSNYDDSQKKVTGGRNGYGAKLCNIFSTKFVVETQCNEYKKAFKQTWQNNMTKAGDAKITSNKGEDYTSVTFYPDLKRFKMEAMDKDIVDLFTRRAYDIAAVGGGIKVILNGKKIEVRDFKSYIDLYIRNKTDDTGSPIKLVHEKSNPRWEVAVAISDKGFQSVSFVNSIATTKGGRHVDHVTDQIVAKLIETIKKKEKKGGISVKPFQVKNHIWVFVNALIENPSFDSQTKENMTLQAKSFGSKCSLTDRFVTNASKCGIVESIQSWMKFKAQEKLNKKCGSSKQSKLKGIPKLDDANEAGTRNSMQCTIILTEGDSAKTLAVAGLGVIGRDRYGVFPLKGKVLNVREATHKQIMENAEINNLIKIIGLRYKEKYDTPESMRTLRYGKIMIMTDQDQDGSHIKGLLINFIHNNWPGLMKQGFLEEFITPIVKVSKKNHTDLSFYSLPEFEEWKKSTDNWHTFKVKYYKGLGTSTSKEAKEYFSDMVRHRIPFKYSGTEDDASVLLAFSRKKIEERKEWLTNWMEERKRRAQLGLPELFLYGKDTKQITYSEFINRELILFSNMDNERSIPSLVDGLKPGQRKVMFTCFKRNLTKEIKVAQLAGSVSEMSSYHHGENSLMGTIIGIAQNFVGSNSVNLLQPIGQFGTRLHGGKDAASPRYIFTALSPLTRLLFHVHDEPLLRFLLDDNQRIEPEYYAPIIPMVLVNGAEGIGTGWSTKIPNYDPREIIKNLKRMISGLDTEPMLPSFKNFKGTIEQIDEQKFVVNGEVSIIDDNTVEITELPVKTWTQTYKENVLEPMLQGSDKVPAMITDYKEYHTDTTVRFVVKMTPEKLAAAEQTGLHKVFKLQSSISTASMVLFDSNGCIKRYRNVDEIMREFYELRQELYQKRKDYMEGMLSAESLKLDNQARFICEKIDGTITIENKPKKELIQMLVRHGYNSDPVKAWKAEQDKLQAMEEDEDDDMSTASGSAGGPDFNYILGMALWCLTKEKKDELLKQRDAKAEELYELKRKTPSDLWKNDLDAFLKELDVVEAQERADANMAVVVQSKTSKGRQQKVKKVAAEETMPSPVGRRVAPRIDPALMAKAKAAARLKEKAKIKKEKGLANFDDDNDDSSSVTGKSLADRLGGGIKKTEAGENKEVKKKRSRPSKDPFAKSPKGKGKKRNIWSEDEDEDDMSDKSMSDDDMSSFSMPSKDRGPKRAASTKVLKYNYDDDDDDNDSNFGTFNGNSKDDDDDFAPKKVAKPVFSDSDDDDLKPNTGLSESPPVSKPVSYKIDSDSGSDDDNNVKSQNTGSSPSGFPASPVMMGDSDDDDNWPPKETESIPKEIPKPKKTLGPKVKTAAQKKEPPKKKAESKKKKDEKQPSIFDAISKISKKTPNVVSKAIFIDSDSGSESGVNSSAKPSVSPANSEVSIPKKKPAQKRKKESDLDISDLSGDEFKPKKPAPKKRAPKKKKAEDDENDIFGAKKSPPKKKAAPKKKKFVDSDASSDDEFTPTKSKSKKKASVDSDDDDDDFNMDSYVPPSRGGRSKQPIKYNFGDSDEEDDDF